MSGQRIQAAICWWSIVVIFISGLHRCVAVPSGSDVPYTVFVGQPMEPGQAGRWSQAEGIVTFVGRRGDGFNLELSSGAGHMQVTVVQAGYSLAELLLKSRVRVAGICLGLHDGVSGNLVGSLSTPDAKDITILQVPLETWQRYPLTEVAALNRRLATNSGDFLVHLRGQFQGTNSDGSFQFQDSTGPLGLQGVAGLPVRPGTEIELLGSVESLAANHVVLNGICRTSNDRIREQSALPVLTTTEQVRWLKPGEAKRRYPVKVRAVVTFLLGSSGDAAGNLQDGTGGIYAWHLVSSDPGIKVQSGDFCEIDGETSPGEFSPGIDCHRLKVLGRSAFPEPARPTWDELASGSLDAQWVEIEGIALSAADQHFELGTQGGRITCFVAGAKNLTGFLNAIVYVRGVVVADWDQSRHVRGLHLNLPSEEFVSLERPVPVNFFSFPAKQIKELLYYNPGESSFRQERVHGTIIGLRDGVAYLTDGTNGLRLRLKEDARLAAGDDVDAAGFPEIDNSTEPPLIVLREALVRVNGHQPLPQPVPIGPVNLLGSQHDATLVQLEAQLIHLGIYGADQVLELQTGARTFFARLPTANGKLPVVPVNSRISVTGVYVFNNGRATGRVEAGPFELLLNSPADVRVLEWPSWWTAQHALMVVSSMSVVMVLGLIWIALLRQQVGRRTAQLSAANQSLEAEMAERKRTENELVQTRSQHLVELERTRIARDIHDELGSTLSQIKLLSEMTLSRNEALSKNQDNNRKISSKALEATRVLDEIVWAVDPHNDTLESLLSYLFNFASDYFSLAGIRFRIDAPTKIPHHVLTTHVRHQLYMAIKETLTNIVNHAQATEVWIRLQLDAEAARFTIEDNGRGFNPGKSGSAPGASGLTNMRKRFEDIGGKFAMESAANQGTRVQFTLPLTKEPRS